VNFMNLLNLYSLANWIPTMMNRSGYSTGTAVLVGTILQVGGTISPFLLAWLVERSGFIPALTATLGVGVVAIALIGQVSGPSSPREVITSRHPPPLGNDAEAVRAGDLIFAAGQVASADQIGVAPEARVNPAFPYYGSPIKQQTRYILNHLQHTFAAVGSSLDHVVKAQVFLTDLNDFYAFDEVWKEFFAHPPPRTTVGIAGLLVEGCRVAIDLIGVTAAEPRRPVP